MYRYHHHHAKLSWRRDLDGLILKDRMVDIFTMLAGLKFVTNTAETPPDVLQRAKAGLLAHIVANGAEDHTDPSTARFIQIGYLTRSRSVRVKAAARAKVEAKAKVARDGRSDWWSHHPQVSWMHRPMKIAAGA